MRLARKAGTSAEGLERHHEALKKEVLEVLLRNVKESGNVESTVSLTEGCNKLLLDDIREKHYKALSDQLQELEKKHSELNISRSALFKAVEYHTQQLKNPENRPLFGGKVYAKKVAHYLELSLNGEDTLKLGIRLAYDLIVKVVGGGSGTSYAETYFDSENRESADSFLEALTKTWPKDPALMELLEQRRKAVKSFEEKRSKFETEIDRLIHKTSLKGSCDFTRA